MSGFRSLVSVIIPVFNGRDFITPCIESVIKQNYPHIEIIVIDDGSTDGTDHVIKKFGRAVTCIRQTNQGTASARNRGICSARGRYLAFLDHDDLWLPEKLTCQIKAMENHRRPDIVFTQLVQFVDPTLPKRERESIILNDAPMPGIAASAALVKRQVFKTVGYFALGERLEWAEWYMRAAQAGVAITMVPKVLVKRRLHLNNKGRSQPDYHKAYFRLVKAALLRSRQKQRQGITQVPPHILRLNSNCD